MKYNNYNPPNITAYVIEVFPKSDVLQDPNDLIKTLGATTISISNSYRASVNEISKTLIGLGFQISPVSSGPDLFVGRKALVRVNYFGESCPTEENIHANVDKIIISGLDYVIRKLK